MKTISNNFVQNTAEFYDKHIILNGLYIFASILIETMLFALHLKENGIYFKTLFPS